VSAARGRAAQTLLSEALAAEWTPAQAAVLGRVSAVETVYEAVTRTSMLQVGVGAGPMFVTTPLIKQALFIWPMPQPPECLRRCRAIHHCLALHLGAGNKLTYT